MSASTPTTASQRLTQAGYILTMFVGGVAMWAGTPLLWLWIAGRTGKVSSTQMGSIVLILVGIPVTMVLIGKLLARLDRSYTARFGIADAGAHNPARWLASMRGGGNPEQPTMLDKVMVVSVGLAFLAFGLYFVFFSAGSQMRNG